MELVGAQNRKDSEEFGGKVEFEELGCKMEGVTESNQIGSGELRGKIELGMIPWSWEIHGVRE